MDGWPWKSRSVVLIHGNLPSFSRGDLSNLFRKLSCLTFCSQHLVELVNFSISFSPPPADTDPRNPNRELKARSQL